MLGPSDLSRLEVSKDVPTVSEGVDGVTPSFQATFYRLGEDRIAKVYRREHVWGLIEFNDPRVRKTILERELQCLQRLSPALAPALEVVEVPGGSQELALTMRRLNPLDFLGPRLSRDEILSEDSLVQLARLIADFHFDHRVCSVADLESSGFSGFLRRLLRQEKGVLLKVLNAANSNKRPLLRLYEIVDRYIVKNERSIFQFQLTTDEPIIGHGDLKSQNVVFTQAEGTVLVLDSAPLHEWRVNTRRMDALFLDTELRLIGRTAEADVFWRAYDDLYRARVRAGGAYLPDQVIQAVDSISRFYRANIFFRLAQNGVESHRAGPALEMMEEICGNL